MGDWQPIETAPLGGKAVLVYAEFGHTGKKRRARFPETVACYRLGWGWLACPGDHQIKPTHWMPLPAPPTPQKSPNLGAGSLGGER